LFVFRYRNWKLGNEKIDLPLTGFQTLSEVYLFLSRIERIERIEEITSRKAQKRRRQKRCEATETDEVQKLFIFY
jgi:hypothetical protein